MLNFELSDMVSFPLKAIAHKTLAGFLAVWLSGFVFLFCCVAMYGDRLDAESGLMDSMSDHCKKAMAAKSTKTSEDVVEISGVDSFDCCGFIPAVFDKNRKIDRIDQPVVISSQRTGLRFHIIRVENKPSATVKLRPYIPDRQYTFIKNQVFRI